VAQDCDGGSIPTRCELVKTKKKQERADPNEITRVKWTLCALSKEPLTPPIVACPQGQLFNKEAVIMHLLQKTLPSAFSYIKGMKDLLELNWAENPEWGKVEGAARFACPVTAIQANGRHGGFAALRGCGCVLSERALREVPSAECLQCRKPFSSETDVLPLNPPPELAEQLLREWKAQQQSLRKAKSNTKKSSKRREKAAADSASPATDDGGAKMKEGQGDETRKRKQPEQGDKAKAEDKKSNKKSDEKATAAAAKRSRVATTTAAVAKTAAAPAAATQMSRAVYESIFLPNGQRQKQATFTHYG